MSMFNRHPLFIMDTDFSIFKEKTNNLQIIVFMSIKSQNKKFTPSRGTTNSVLTKKKNAHT